MGRVRVTPFTTKGGLALGVAALVSLSACNLGEDPTAYAAPSFGLFAGDLDGDGDVDLVSGGGDTYAVLLNDGSGVFTATVVEEHVDFTHMLLMDVDDDDRDDMVLLTFLPGDPPTVPPAWHLGTRLSNGDGTFGDTTVVGSTPALDVPQEAVAIAAGDLDADGRSDVVLYQSGEGAPGSAAAFLRTGADAFGPAVVSPSTSAVLTARQLSHSSSATADLTGDGKLDLVVAGWGPWPGDPGSRGQIAVLTGDGGGGFTATASYATAAGASDRAIGPGVGDFDGDGRLDVVTADTRLAGPSETLTFWFGTPGGTLDGPEPRDGRGEQATDLEVGDVDGDGHLDVVTVAHLHGDETSGSGWWLKGDGTGQVSAPTKLLAAVPHDAEHGGVIARDLDGDGKLDLAVANGIGTVTVFRNRLGA